MKKKKYEAPAMQVFELKARQSLLAGSGNNIQGFKSSGKVDDWSNFQEENEY